MPHEQNKQDTAYGVAVRSLKNELSLAVRLLRQIKEGRETLVVDESHLVNSARAAFRHAAEALDRMPQLEPVEMQAVHRLMDEFRAALADLNT